MSGEPPDIYLGPPRPDPGQPGTTTGRRHPQTSHDAASRAFPRSGTQRRQVLEHIVAQHPDGATDDEMQQALGMLHQSQTARRGELVKLGWIVDSGRKRRTATGADAIVWVYLPEGAQ